MGKDRAPRAWRTVLGLLALAVVLQGCAANGPRPGEAADRAELTRLSDAWDAAIVRKDRPAIAGNMTRDFRQIRGSGAIVDRETFLRDITEAGLAIDPYTVEDFEIRIYGDVALLSGRTRMTGRSDGEPFKAHYRYIDIYVREDGRWRVCSVQITKVPD